MSPPRVIAVDAHYLEAMPKLAEYFPGLLPRTLVVTGAWWFLFPALRRIDRPQDAVLLREEPPSA